MSEGGGQDTDETYQRRLKAADHGNRIKTLETDVDLLKKGFAELQTTFQRIADNTDKFVNFIEGTNKYARFIRKHGGKLGYALVGVGLTRGYFGADIAAVLKTIVGGV
jgi:hypothetical protein